MRLQVAIPLAQWLQKADLVPKACFVHPTLYWGEKRLKEHPFKSERFGIYIQIPLGSWDLGFCWSFRQ